MGERIGSGLYMDEVVERCFDPNFTTSRLLSTSIFQEHTLNDIELSLVHGVMLDTVQDPRLRLTMLGLEACYEQEGLPGPDRFTIEHSAADTNFIATAICVRLGLMEEYLVHASQGAVAHDNWKDDPEIQQLIHYRGQLTQEQRQRYIYPHPNEGAERALSNGLHLRVGKVIGAHHGFAGDPYGFDPQAVFGPFEEGKDKEGEEYSPELLAAMAVAVADVYGSARSHRPDRPSENHDGAMQWVGGLTVARYIVRTVDELFRPTTQHLPDMKPDGLTAAGYPAVDQALVHAA